MRYEVRCCCEPQKLRGWIELEGSDRVYRFKLLPLLSFAERVKAPKEIDVIEMRVDLFQNGDQRYLALKAEGIPVEKLKRIPGFIPA